MLWGLTLTNNCTNKSTFFTHYFYMITHNDTEILCYRFHIIRSLLCLFQRQKSLSFLRQIVWSSSFFAVRRPIASFKKTPPLHLMFHKWSEICSILHIFTNEPYLTLTWLPLDYLANANVEYPYKIWSIFWPASLSLLSKEWQEFQVSLHHPLLGCC